MNRVTVFTHGNQWQVLPSISINEELPYYLYLDFQWLKWGVSFTIVNKENI